MKDRRYGAPSPKKQDEGECEVRSREASPESDVDVLYELEPGARLGWDIEKLADELAGLLGRPVDLVSRNSLHERLRDQVLAEALPLYAV